MISTRIAFIASSVLVCACAASLPPGPPIVRTATEVAAPVDRTWEAAVEVFANENIPIKTLDRSSGLIVAETQPVARQDGLADCGTAFGTPLSPDAATWNLLVRGDSLRSTVKATVRFTHRLGAADEECGTRGVWETALERKLKAAAEAKPR